MASSQVASSGQRWFIVKYIAPNNVAIIEGIVVAFGQPPHGKVLTETRDFNANLAETEWKNYKEEIALAMETASLEVMMANFFSNRKSWAQDRRMWCMLRQGREVRSQKDYRRWWYQEGIGLETIGL